MTRFQTKPIVRESCGPGAPGGRAIIVSLIAPNIIRLREKGTKREFDITVEAAFWLGAKQAAEANKRGGA